MHNMSDGSSRKAQVCEASGTEWVRQKNKQTYVIAFFVFKLCTDAK